MNRKPFLALILVFFSFALHAQKFEPVFQTSLPDTMDVQELSWIDFDNDGLLDVLVSATDTTNKQLFAIYRSDTTHRVDTLQVLAWKVTVATGLTDATVFLTDADLDNDMDVVTSGYDDSAPVTWLWKNNGDFSFTSEIMIDQSVKVMKFGDLDEDGEKEILVSRLDSVMVMQTFLYKRMDNAWQIYDTLTYDTLAFEAISMEVFDVDNDGDNDFFVSGVTEDDSTVTSMFYNEGGLAFSRADIKPEIAGITSRADINHDGFFDILIAGMDSTGENTTRILKNYKGILVAENELTVTADRLIPFAADFDSNGKCDVSFRGLNIAGDTINIIVNDQQQIDTLVTAGLKTQVFGDADRDGDLDVLQVLESSSGLELVLSYNKTDSVNFSPGAPLTGIGVKIFDRLFLYWDKSMDDRTPSDALTYDVALYSLNQELIVGEFDLMHTKRLTVSHGNIGTNNFALLKGNAVQGQAFTVQAVDNAFHAGPNDTGGSGVCSGTSVSCAEVSLQHFQVCKTEQVSLSASANALWFSFSDGFLGESQVLELEATQPDTIFSFSPGVFDCSAVNVYVIGLVKKLKRTISQVKDVCEGQQIDLGVETGWQSVSWQSALNGFLSNEDSVSFTVTKEDTITVKVDDGTGCELQRKLALKISKPVVTVNGEIFQMLKGEQVQLVAEGGERYLWTPAEGLSSDTIPDPVASPQHTTEYIVTATDRVGCAATAKVLVMVEPTAFIPNLFTPNDDGKNDEIKIYGLAAVKNFTFSIHNREGSTVYETSNFNEALTTGWNGTVRGSKQPSGVYYWKVSGEYNSGRRLLLNGKLSGAIVLIR